MLMTLGTFVFSLEAIAYQEVARSLSWRHASSDRLGARAAHQFLGPGDETIELPCVVVPEISGTLDAADTLRQMADEGRALPLVDGNGTVLGAFVITDSRERSTHFSRDGRPRKLELTLTLKRVDDRADGEQGLR